MNALHERHLERERFVEYCAALPTWITYSLNRAKQAPAHGPEYFMFQYRARQDLQTPIAASAMRYALPGERPPSTRAPGQRDDIIERFDMFVNRTRRSNGG